MPRKRSKHTKGHVHISWGGTGHKHRNAEKQLKKLRKSVSSSFSPFNCEKSDKVDSFSPYVFLKQRSFIPPHHFPK